MPGLKSSPAAGPLGGGRAAGQGGVAPGKPPPMAAPGPLVEGRAPEKARFARATPPPMWASAAFERWQPEMASPLDVSQYAVEPSASTRDESLLVLPAQRPASPEIAESPSVTTVG